MEVTSFRDEPVTFERNIRAALRTCRGAPSFFMTRLNRDDAAIEARTNRRLGRRIAACRSAAGATLADTADRVGVSLQIFQRYETGEVGLTIGRLVRICQALEVPTAMMLEGIVDPPKPGEDDADMGVQFARILGRLPQAKRLAVLALVREMAR